MYGLNPLNPVTCRQTYFTTGAGDPELLTVDTVLHVAYDQINNSNFATGKHAFLVLLYLMAVAVKRASEREAMNN